MKLHNEVFVEANAAHRLIKVFLDYLLRFLIVYFLVFLVGRRNKHAEKLMIQLIRLSFTKLLHILSGGYVSFRFRTE